MPTLKIIVASTRPGRIGPSIAAWTHAQALQHGAFSEVELIDLAEFALPFMNEPHHPRLRQHTQDRSAQVEAADAFVFVMPEYNYGYNAELKNAIDYLHHEWQYKAVGLVSYGGVSGGTRAAQMIKQVVTTLKMTPVPEAVSIPFAGQYLSEDGTLRPNDVMNSAAHKMFDELFRMTSALSVLRGSVMN